MSGYTARQAPSSASRERCQKCKVILSRALIVACTVVLLITSGLSFSKEMGQMSLMSGANRDFILEYRLRDDRVESGLILHEGKDENFFLAVIEPPVTIKQQTPMLSAIKVKFDGADVYDVEPEGLPDVYSSQRVMVFGKWRGERPGILTIEGDTGDGRFIRIFNLAQEPRA